MEIFNPTQSYVLHLHSIDKDSKGLLSVRAAWEPKSKEYFIHSDGIIDIKLGNKFYKFVEWMYENPPPKYLLVSDCEFLLLYEKYEKSKYPTWEFLLRKERDKE